MIHGHSHSEPDLQAPPPSPIFPFPFQFPPPPGTVPTHCRIGVCLLLCVLHPSCILHAARAASQTRPYLASLGECWLVGCWLLQSGYYCWLLADFHAHAMALRASMRSIPHLALPCLLGSKAAVVAVQRALSIALPVCRASPLPPCQACPYTTICNPSPLQCIYLAAVRARAHQGPGDVGNNSARRAVRFAHSFTRCASCLPQS